MNDLGIGVYLQFALALVFVLALIGLLALATRRLGLGYRAPSRTGKRRLSIVEVMPIDAKRRLVLVRRDRTEHLVLLGAASETLVERGIAADDDFAATIAAVGGDEARP